MLAGALKGRFQVIVQAVRQLFQSESVCGLVQIRKMKGGVKSSLLVHFNPSARSLSLSSKPYCVLAEFRLIEISTSASFQDVSGLAQMSN